LVIDFPVTGYVFRSGHPAAFHGLAGALGSLWVAETTGNEIAKIAP
jgi:hypothetical protein